MTAFISILIILASILLVIVVFVQNPKGGGLSSDFGSAQQLGGVQRTSDFIEKATWGLAGSIMVLSIVFTISTKKPAEKLPANGQTTEQTGGQGQQGQAGQQGQGAGGQKAN